MLHVRRVKRGTDAAHPIIADELRALRKLQRGAGAEESIRVHVGARITVRHVRLR
jgi:hypothetical protein